MSFLKKTQFWVGTTILFSALALGQFLVHRKGHFKGTDRLAQELNLTDQQTRKLKTLFHESKKHRREHRRLIRKLEKEFAKKMETPSVTVEQLEEAHQKLMAEKNDVEVSRFKKALQIRDIIGAEKMKPFFEHRHKKFRQRMKHRFGHDDRSGSMDERHGRDGDRRAGHEND
ncbi:MAG: hypothetical protein CL675_12780 [Bdellovibrionaceae bacterium]|nr:hypothetical protein [Pseudobdellovibrionaceae bacterium]